MVNVASSAEKADGITPEPRRRAPGPLAILGGLFVVITVLSSLLAALGVTFTGADGKRTPLLGFFSADGITNLLTSAIHNFVSFPALGVTLTMVLGLGVAQGTGALEAGVRMAFARGPRRSCPTVCCQGHMLSDGSYVLLPPLAMQIFKAKGRNPLAGLITGLACVSVGYGGGLIFGTSDVGYTAVTESAAKTMTGVHGYVTGVTMNYFITATIGIVLPIVLGWVSAHILEPRIGFAATADADVPAAEPVVTPEQRRAVWIGLAGVVVYAAIVIGWWLSPGSVLRGHGGALVQSPFLKNLVPLLATAFIVFGMVYARVAGIPAEQRKLLPLMTNSIKDMAGFIVIVFFLSQVISVLTWSKLSDFFAVGIASVLENLGITGYWALLGLALLTAMMGLFITGTALWGLEAPVMVPALMRTGLSPAALQVAFRMSHGWGAVVSPANVFIYFTYNEARKVNPNVTIGWLIRRTGYFVIPGALTWFVVLAFFYFGGLPVGPGAGLRLH